MELRSLIESAAATTTMDRSVAAKQHQRNNAVDRTLIDAADRSVLSRRSSSASIDPFNASPPKNQQQQRQQQQWIDQQQQLRQQTLVAAAAKQRRQEVDRSVFAPHDQSIRVAPPPLKAIKSHTHTTTLYYSLVIFLPLLLYCYLLLFCLSILKPVGIELLCRLHLFVCLWCGVVWCRVVQIVQNYSTQILECAVSIFHGNNF